MDANGHRAAIRPVLEGNKRSEVFFKLVFLLFWNVLRFRCALSRALWLIIHSLVPAFGFNPLFEFEVGIKAVVEVLGRSLATATISGFSMGLQLEAV